MPKLHHWCSAGDGQHSLLVQRVGALQGAVSSVLMQCTTKSAGFVQASKEQATKQPSRDGTF
eukprot:1158274-Pelagomonas_calceolata.AAC.31